MEKDIDKLIQGLCRQDGQAQRCALELYGKMIFGQIARIVAYHEDAEEVY